jgi:predicted enzyme related to lactoylglutathione lyase
MSCPPTQQLRHSGAFCWIGLASSDPAAVFAFYASLFGWEGEELPAGEFGTYTALRRDGAEVAILYRQTREARAARAAPHWTPFVAVEDADAGAVRARELDGAVLREPLDFVNAGRVAALRDPTGGIVSLWQARAHAGAELTGDVGALCWHELATSDVERAKSFYGELLGWHYEDDSSGCTTITRYGSRIGIMRELGDGNDVTASRWIAYFGVESVQDTAHEAERNGRRILSASAVGPIGRTALLADPQGATFALLAQTKSTYTKGEEN